jgi:hypothetical protein
MDTNQRYAVLYDLAQRQQQKLLFLSGQKRFSQEIAGRRG